MRTEITLHITTKCRNSSFDKKARFSILEIDDRGGSTYSSTPESCFLWYTTREVVKLMRARYGLERKHIVLDVATEAERSAPLFTAAKK